MNTLAATLSEQYVRTVNSADASAFSALFADDAIVDDANREFRGRAAIDAWAQSDIFAPRVSLEVLDVAERDDATVFTAKVDGNFDRTGLPDPVIIAHRITQRDGKITSLTCRLAELPVTSLD